MGFFVCGMMCRFVKANASPNNTVQNELNKTEEKS